MTLNEQALLDVVRKLDFNAHDVDTVKFAASFDELRMHFTVEELSSGMASPRADAALPVRPSHEMVENAAKEIYERLPGKRLEWLVDGSGKTQDLARITAIAVLTTALRKNHD